MPKPKFEVDTTFRSQDMGLQNVQYQGQHQDLKGRDQCEWIGLWKVAINRHLFRIVVIGYRDILYTNILYT
jgi:hypothetical protein